MLIEKERKRVDARKDYVAPATTAEDTLEQTSLACNMTSVVLYWNDCAAQINQKNGGFWADDFGAGTCDVPVFDGTPTVYCEPVEMVPGDQVGTLFS